MGDTVPSVDICIAYCGESVSVILDTLAAAAAQDYPASQYRVFVLDDSRHDPLREQVSIFAEKTRATHGPMITYLARRKLPGVRHYFKAGNFRHGFESSAQLGRGSEMFAALDADMIVASDWLRRLVPYLNVHDRLALACPPQLSPSLARARDSAQSVSEGTSHKLAGPAPAAAAAITHLYVCTDANFQGRCENLESTTQGCSKYSQPVPAQDPFML
ncbi:MAG: hypothetical protein Q9173_002551 [Seirophora scorigena]